MATYCILLVSDLLLVQEKEYTLLLGTILLTLYVSQVIDSQAVCQSRGLECISMRIFDMQLI